MREDSRSIGLREAQMQGRQILVDHVAWLVYEFASVFDRRATPSLVFESENAVRRVRNYPQNWRSLGAKELFALSWNS